MRRIQGLLAGAAFTLYAAVGVAAFAQPGPRPSGTPARGAMMMGPAGATDIAQRLRDVLQLRPAQEPALQAYAGALASARQGMMAGFADQRAPLSTPDRLSRMQQMMAQHEAAFATVADATRRFYDQLDPAQKRSFDALSGMMMGHGMGGMGLMGGYGGGPMMGPPPLPPQR